LHGSSARALPYNEDACARCRAGLDQLYRRGMPTALVREAFGHGPLLPYRFFHVLVGLLLAAFGLGEVREL